MRLYLLIIGIAARIVIGQDTCQNDEDCDGDGNCCSSFGFCGTGEGFCTPAPRRSGSGGARPASGGRGRTRSGAGCVLDDAEWVGGDLPAIVGGGGIRLDRDDADECFNRCDENPRCEWYTYDTREDLCYLKSGRGYLRNRTDGFVSGATFRDGCNEDPFCDKPYNFYGHQCLLFSNDYWDASIADVRRNINNSREVCDELGGFLPHDYSGYSGVGGFGDQWHWVGYGANDNNCWACRPSRWREGVRAFPCNTPLPFGCQRRRAYPLPFPRRRPKIYRERLAFPVDDLLDARPGPRFRNTLESPFVPRRNLNSVLRNNPYLYI